MQLLLRQLTINLRLLLILALALIAMASVSMIATQQERKAIMQQKNLQLSQLLELGHNTLNHFYQKTLTGELTEAEAKKKAFSVIRDFRFTTNKDKDYFFILDKQGTTLMHGQSAALENTSMKDSKDPSGFAFIQDLLEKSRYQSQGQSSYTWDKPGFSNP